MKRFSVILIALLSGCATLDNMDNGKEVDCTAHFNSETFAVPGYYLVNINRVRYDRFGNEFVRPSSNNDINFIGGGYHPISDFSDFECKKGKV